MSPDKSWNALIRPWISDRYFDAPYPCLFETEAQECSWVNAWWLCELSRLIYRPGPDETGPESVLPARSEILGCVGLQEIETFSSGANHCALIASRKSDSSAFASLVFRGTCGFEGWLSNMKAIQSDWTGGGSVHSGFKTDFLGLWQKIEPSLSKIDLPLYVTGHSLGGALAILAASIFPVQAVYTFGAPKAGDAVFAESLKNTRIYRYENARDIVPTVPPSAIPFDFCHCGIPIRLADAEDAGTVTNGIRTLKAPPDFLSDHAPVNYTIRLEEKLGEVLQ